MDEDDISALLDDISEPSELEYSGSEYIPSSNDGSDTEGEEFDQDILDYDDVGYDDIGQIDSVSDNEADDNAADNNAADNNAADDNIVQNQTRQLQNQTSNTWGDCQVTVRQYPFTGKPGQQYDFDKTNPLGVFAQFVTEEIINLMVEETNRFARQLLAAAPVKRRSIMKKWVDCTPTEIKQFLGILIIMGLSPAPKLRLYWSNNDIYEKKLIKKTMGRDRFDMILKCWHFYDNENVPAEEEARLSKIKPLVDKVNERCKAVFCPEETIVVDESMIPWRGRLIIRQYNPQKAHKYGVKVYKLCSTNGYTLKMKIYAGKDDITGNKGHAQKVVEHLVADFIEEGRSLYADNFYSSVPLAESLLKKKTYVCGTLRGDRRGLPKEFVKEKIKKGEVEAKENQNGVRIIKWQDKRRVLMLSTRPEDSANLIPTGKNNRAGVPILKPTAVVAYNKAKKGVDISDQLSSYYTPLRKTSKWYKKVAVELLLGTCVINAFVIFNEGRQKKWELLKFREVLLRELIKPDVDPAPGPPPIENQPAGKISQKALLIRKIYNQVFIN